MNRGEYSVILDQASWRFQAAVNRDAAERYFRAIHDQVGDCPPPDKPDYLFSNANTSGTTIRVRYSLRCEKQPLTEEIIFEIEDGLPRLDKYQASVPFELK